MSICKMRIPVLVFAVFLWSGAAAGQSAPKAKISGSIEGASGATTTVILQPTERNPLAYYDGYSTRARSDGRFEFRDIDPGTYLIIAKAPGFMPSRYEGADSLAGGTPVALSAGQNVRGITIRLTPKRVVCGEVTDENGRPISNAAVWAYERRKGSNWIVTDWGKGLQTKTDSNGRYRLPNLNPGEYFIQAAPYTWYVGKKDLTQNEAEMFSNAEPVEVGPDARGGCQVNIRVGLRLGWRGFHVRGVLLGYGGAAASGVNVRLMLTQTNRSGALMDEGQFGSFKPEANGEDFDYPGLRPGQYRLIAYMGGPPIQARWPLSNFRIVASRDVEVSQSDVDGIVLKAGETGSIEGAVKLEGISRGESCPSKVPMHVSVHKADGEFQETKVEAGGRFSFGSLSLGTYTVSVYPFCRGAVYVKTMTLDGKAIEGRDVRVSHGSSHTLHVVLSGDPAGALGHAMPEDFDELYEAEYSHPKATVSGRVTHMSSDPPAVELRAVRFNSDRSYKYSAKPGADGAFRFTHIDPGIYVLLTRGKGYLVSEYGAKGPGLEGIAITLRAGQHLDGVRLRATPQRSVCGRVTDVQGRPLSGVYVTVWPVGPRTLYLEERPALATDIAGRYRISHLGLGTYFLIATVPFESKRGVWVERRTYYPSAPNLEAARPITVRGDYGRTCRYDIRVPDVRRFHIRGTLPRFSATGRGQELDLELADLGHHGLEIPLAFRRLPPGGSFDFGDLPDGQYRITAIPGRGALETFSGPCWPQADIAGTSEVVVRGHDVNNVTISPYSRVRVTGNIQYENIPKDWRAFSPEDQRVYIQPYSGTCALSTRDNHAGSFSIRGANEGAYRLGIDLMKGGNLYVKAIYFNGKRLRGRRIELKSGEPATLKIVVSDSGGSFDAKVRPSGPPPEKYLHDSQCQPNWPSVSEVILIPDTLPPDGSGVIVGPYEGVPPGSYHAIAVKNFELHFGLPQNLYTPWGDPAFLRRARALGTPVRIVEGQKTTLTLRSVTVQLQDLFARYGVASLVR